MHIPDGFLSTPVWAALDVAAVPAVGYLAKRAQRGLEQAKVPLLGVMGAFVFAAQMINFPVGLGTSGHLVGAALLAYTLGPAAAGIVLTAILAVQALVFQDGGILALGANVLNMAVLGMLAGYLPFRFWARGRWRRQAILLGGVLSVLVSAIAALAELRLSGVRMPMQLFQISIALFFISALLEGAITLAVMETLESINAGFIHRPASNGRSLGWVMAATVLLATVGVLFASAYPDAIQKLAEAKVFVDTPLAGYEAAFLGTAWMRKAVAGLAGLVLIFGACTLCGRLLSRQRGA
jgi:cobalt/nickel transport system permease protein